MDVKLIEQKLNDKDFFKKACPGRFLFWPYWKKSHARYMAATEKGVCKSVKLREFAYAENVYSAMAYSTNGDIPAETVEELKSILGGVDIGNIRYEAHGTNGFFPLLNAEGGMQMEDHSIKALCQKLQDIYIIIVSEIDTDDFSKVTSSQIAYAKSGKEMWQWAIIDSNLM